MQKSVRLALGISLLGAMGGCAGQAGQASEGKEPIGSLQQADFVNGNFEDGTLNGWTVTTGLNPTIPVFPPVSVASLGITAGGTNKTSVKTAATPESVLAVGIGTNDTLKYPRFGKNAAVVNEMGSSNNTNMLTQTMTTTPADVDASDGNIHVRFALAPVLQNPSHINTQQPYFYVEIRNTTQGKVLWSSFNFSGQAGVPWKNDTGGNGSQYTDWQLFDVAPGPADLAIGDKVQANIIAAGCSQGGHWGHLYVDGFGPFIPGLTVAASAASSANADTDLVYTFLAKNGGDKAATGVVVEEFLPAGTTYVSTMGGNCVFAAGPPPKITCTLGDLPAGGSSTFKLTVHIDKTATGSVNNGNYNIISTGTSPLIGPLVQTAITTGVNYADLGVTVTDGAAAVEWGAPISYKVVVTNSGPTAVTGAKITDLLPAGLTGVTWTCVGANGGVCSAANGSGSLNTAADLPVGATVTYTVNGTVANGTGPGSLSYRVNVAPPATVVDNVLRNNSAVDTNAVGKLYSLSVDKTGSIGSGAIISSPMAISCGAGCTTQTAKFLEGQTVTLTAVPDPGKNYFDGWGGDCASAGKALQCTITITKDTNVSALFAVPTHSINTTTPDGHGSIVCTPNPVPDAKDSVCTITPEPGYEVDMTTLDGTDVTGQVSNNTYTIPGVTGPHDVAITFKKSLGTACGDQGECKSGFCVDGVCCNSTCDGQCNACDVAGSAGTCSPVIGAAPHGSRPQCAGNLACGESGACYDTCVSSAQCAAGSLCAAGSCVSASEYKLTGGGLLGCDVSGQRGSSASAASALGALTLLAMAARRRRVRA